jgi:hypothetical protein
VAKKKPTKPKKAIKFVGPNGSVLTARQKRVVDYITEHGSISAQEAEEHLHNHRLASTIEILRHRKGYDIVTHRIDVTNAYGEPSWYGRYVFRGEKK